MWRGFKYKTCGASRFFRIALGHENLVAYYQTTFGMMQHHKYSLEEIENMMPFEREIYLTMLGEHIKQENERQREMAQQQKSRR